MAETYKSNVRVKSTVYRPYRRPGFSIRRVMTSKKWPLGILEIETAPTVIRLRLRGIGPVGKRTFLNPTKNFVELRFGALS
jgi:hypothetical protein